MKRTHGVKNHKCTKCTTSFCTVQQLNSHILDIHEKPLKCKECGKAFGNQKILDGHIKRIHFEEKSLKCEKCNDMFVLQTQLNRHIKLRHNKSFSHECSKCLKTFNLKKTLDLHIEKEHEQKKGERCAYCGKNYNRLKAHVQICTHRWGENDRPIFQCSNCDKKFISRDSLRGRGKLHCQKANQEMKISLKQSMKNDLFCKKLT